LTSINIKKNNIAAAQEEEIYQSVRMNKLRVALSDKTLTELDVSGIGFRAEGAKLVAQYISDNGAMTSLNLSDNELGAEGAKHIAKGITVSKCVVAVILAQFSCPSGHWLDCCCSLLFAG
jgi:Ran GTPase-activating protein (RanGAP) involved in mRNA processing and transport